MTKPRVDVDEPTTSGVSVADFMADPAKAIAAIKAEIRADIKREIIGANLMMGAILYVLLKGNK